MHPVTQRVIRGRDRLLTSTPADVVGFDLWTSASTALVTFSIFGYALAPAWALFAGFSLMHGLGSGAIDAG